MLPNSRLQSLNLSSLSIWVKVELIDLAWVGVDGTADSPVGIVELAAEDDVVVFFGASGAELAVFLGKSTMEISKVFSELRR